MKGKAGVGPLEDSHKKPAKDAFAEARAATGQDKEPDTEKFDNGQTTMPAGTPDTPKPVRNGRMLCHFVAPHFSRTKDDEPMIAFELSFPLTDDHKNILPREVEHAWKIIQSGGVNPIGVIDIPPQTVGLALVPDDKDDLTIVAAEIIKASLQIVKEKGAGKTKQVVRYKFRVSTERTKDTIYFATTHDGSQIWYSAKKTQESLLD